MCHLEHRLHMAVSTHQEMGMGPLGFKLFLCAVFLDAADSSLPCWCPFVPRQLRVSLCLLHVFPALGIVCLFHLATVAGVQLHHRVILMCVFSRVFAYSVIFSDKVAFLVFPMAFLVDL